MSTILSVTVFAAGGSGQRLVGCILIPLRASRCIEGTQNQRCKSSLNEKGGQWAECGVSQRINSDAQVLFQRRTEELFCSLGEQLSAREVAELRTSIEEGNHSEVIRAIAWIVEKKDGPASRLAKLKISELSRDLTDLRDMPESFRGMLLEETKSQSVSHSERP